MKIRFKKDIELEMVKSTEENISYYDRKFKKGEIVEVDCRNIPWSEDWQFSFTFEDCGDFSSVNIRHFEIVDKEDREEIEKLLKQYPNEE